LRRELFRAGFFAAFFFFFGAAFLLAAFLFFAIAMFVKKLTILNDNSQSGKPPTKNDFHDFILIIIHLFVKDKRFFKKMWITSKN